MSISTAGRTLTTGVTLPYHTYYGWTLAHRLGPRKPKAGPYRRFKKTYEGPHPAPPGYKMPRRRYKRVGRKSTYSRQRAQKFRISKRRRGYGRTSGFYGRFSGQGAELKFHDVDADDAIVANGGAVTTLLQIAQGTTESERLGRKITLRSINCRFEITLPSTTVVASTSDVIRVLIVQDKQCNGAIPPWATILESNDYQSFNQLANKSRFRTLMDRTYAIQATAGSGQGTTNTKEYAEAHISDTFFKKCNIPIEYDNSGTTGAITEIRSNNILLLLISRDNVAGFFSKFRFRYSDS